jgi:hypothetical protein
LWCLKTIVIEVIIGCSIHLEVLSASVSRFADLFRVLPFVSRALLRVTRGNNTLLPVTVRASFLWPKLTHLNTWFFSLSLLEHSQCCFNWHILLPSLWISQLIMRNHNFYFFYILLIVSSTRMSRFTHAGHALICEVVSSSVDWIMFWAGKILEVYLSSIIWYKWWIINFNY